MNPTFDNQRIEELMEEFAAAGTPEKRRELENEVLAETVWKMETEPFATFTREEYDRIAAAVDTDDKALAALIRSPYIMNL